MTTLATLPIIIPLVAAAATLVATRHLAIQRFVGITASSLLRTSPLIGAPPPPPAPSQATRTSHAPQRRWSPIWNGMAFLPLRSGLPPIPAPRDAQVPPP